MPYVGPMVLAHDVAGSGAAVVLLHSSVGDRRMWDAQWQPLLDAGYRVVRCDFRGHGESPPATGQFNAAEDVRDLLGALGIERAALIGSSYGGRVAQEVAARWPARVSTLLLICAATRLHPPTPAILAFGTREDELLSQGDLDGAVALNLATFLGPRATPQTRAAVAVMQRRTLEIQLNTPGRAPARYSSFVRNDDYDLSAVTAGTVVVSGEHDVDYFRTTADHLATAIPAARRVTLDWAGHLPTVEDPATTTPMLLDWLKHV